MISMLSHLHCDGARGGTRLRAMHCVADLARARGPPCLCTHVFAHVRDSRFISATCPSRFTRLCNARNETCLAYNSPGLR